MKFRPIHICALLVAAPLASHAASAQPLDKIRVARSSDSATEAALWFAKDAGLYEKHGLSVELLRLSGSSLVVSTMLAGEMPFSQIGAAAVIDANLAGGDLVIITTLIKNFVYYIYSRPEIQTFADLKGKAIGVTRYGANSDFAATKFGLQPEKDIAILQTSGPAESVSALSTNRIQAVALTAPATIRARKLGLREILDVSKLEANFPFNGMVATRSFLKNNFAIVRRFLMAQAEGVALAKRDGNFARKVLAKYFRNDDKEILDESYNWIVKQNYNLPPYPALAGLSTILKATEARNPKAKNAKPEDFVDSRFVQELDKSGFFAELNKAQ
jgi:NitT/TauT family transport system substrate-binding protein